MNLIKGEAGVIAADVAEATDQRIAQATRLMGEIDRIVLTTPNLEERHLRLHELKQRVDNANLSTVCDKSELEIPVGGMRINMLQAATRVVSDWWDDLLTKKPE